MSQTACEKLFRDYRHAYQKWLDESAAYNQQEHSTSFDKSQFIEWEGKPYNCLKNTTKWNCSTFADAKHQKAKCQQLYMGRPHLHAPCDPAKNGGEPLTQEYCMDKGYLSHNGLDTQLESLVSGGKNPTPKLQLPPISCEECRSEFETLAKDFSYQNLSKVAHCIEGVKQHISYGHTYPTTPSTTHTSSTTSNPTSSTTSNPTSSTTSNPTSTTSNQTNTPPLAQPSSSEQVNNARRKHNARQRELLEAYYVPELETKETIGTQNPEGTSEEQENQSVFEMLQDHSKIAIGIIIGLAILCILFSSSSQPQMVYGVPNNGLVSYGNQFSQLYPSSTTAMKPMQYI